MNKQLDRMMRMAPYINMPCRICGDQITMDDLGKTEVRNAGYDKTEKTTAAHEGCWYLHIQGDFPKKAWEFPEDKIEIGANKAKRISMKVEEGTIKGFGNLGGRLLDL